MNSEQPNPPSPHDAPLRRVEAIYFEIAPLSPIDREAAIVRLCAGDKPIESEVRGLLEHADRIGAFLEEPALGRPWADLPGPPLAEALPDDLIGATLGSFRIQRRIAAGGMGAVYLAARSDGAFEQQVAIKVVRKGLDSEEILARFRAERQTLAALNHPNIARLIDGGLTPDARPFLVMEYVDGKPIDEFCDSRRLKITDRLRLFRDVCDAVHHAHQNLIIHRDIKPSNILVTEAGVPKLLDFGIAKLLAPDSQLTPVTIETDRRLTPEYASPEQIEGRAVTTATDVYSLGVVLYELLTGARPYSFTARTHEELRRIVCDLVPPAPSSAVTMHVSRMRTDAPSGTPATTNAATSPADAPKTRGLSSTRLRSTLRGDLDNIALMALRKEPQRRYASAEQFASDITRYLDGLPVRARRDTLAYRASKFLRRHAAGTALTLTAILALAAASVTLFEQRQALRVQRDQLIATNRRLDASRDFLQEILSGAETGNNGPDQTLGTLLNDAAQALESSPPEDPLTKAASQQALGRSFMSIGDLDRAQALLAAAEPVLIAQPHSLSATGSDIRVDLAELLFFQGKHAEAETQFRALLAEERQAAGAAHTIREGLLLSDLGAALRAQRKFDQAIDAQQQSVAIRLALLGEDSLPLASSRNNLASSLLQSGDIAGAVDQFTRSLATRRKLLRDDHPLVVRCQANLGLAQIRAGDIDAAIATLTTAVNAWDKAFGPDHPGRVSASTSLSIALRKKQRQPEAIAVLQAALVWQQQHHVAAPLIAGTEANIALAAAEQGHDDEARATLERTLPVLLASPAQSGIAKTAGEALAAIYDRAGRPDDAARVRAQIK